MQFVPLIIILLAFVVFYKLVMNGKDSKSYKQGMIIGLVSAFFLMWASLAVGIFGVSDPLELGALSIGFVVAAVHRFSSKGMFFGAMLAAILQLLMPVMAYIDGSLSSTIWHKEILFNSVFAVLFAISATKFKKSMS